MQIYLGKIKSYKLSLCVTFYQHMLQHKRLVIMIFFDGETDTQ